MGKLTLQLGNRRIMSVERSGGKAGTCFAVTRSARSPAGMGPLLWVPSPRANTLGRVWVPVIHAPLLTHSDPRCLVFPGLPSRWAFFPREHR